MKDFKWIRVIIYVICIGVIALWSIVGFLSYNVSMAIISVLFSSTLVLEAIEAHHTHHRMIMYRDLGLAVVFVVASILVFVLGL